MKWTLSRLKNTIAIRYWSFLNVPLLYHMKPIVYELSEEKAKICIPLCRKNKNHFNSIYMGSLVGGADLACGILAQHLIKLSKENISIIFKDINAKFIKRPESNAFFICEDGPIIKNLIKKTISSNKRQNHEVEVTAYCPEKFSDEAVAHFTLSLSLKIQNK